MATTGNGLTACEARWLGQVRACGSDSLKAYADAHGLNVRALYDAKARLKRKGALAADAPARLVRVERAPNNAAEAAYCRVHLENGAAVELRCAPEQWAALFASVAALP